MFFFRRGDIASAVNVPTAWPSIRIGHGSDSQGRITSSPGTSTPTSLRFTPLLLIVASAFFPMKSDLLSRSTSHPSPASYGFVSRLMSDG